MLDSAINVFEEHAQPIAQFFLSWIYTRLYDEKYFPTNLSD